MSEIMSKVRIRLVRLRRFIGGFREGLDPDGNREDDGDRPRRRAYQQPRSARRHPSPHFGAIQRLVWLNPKGAWPGAGAILKCHDMPHSAGVVRQCATAKAARAGRVGLSWPLINNFIELGSRTGRQPIAMGFHLLWCKADIPRANSGPLCHISIPSYAVSPDKRQRHGWGAKRWPRQKALQRALASIDVSDPSLYQQDPGGRCFRSCAAMIPCTTARRRGSDPTGR